MEGTFVVLPDIDEKDTLVVAASWSTCPSLGAKVGGGAGPTQDVCTLAQCVAARLLIKALMVALVRGGGWGTTDYYALAGVW